MEIAKAIESLEAAESCYHQGLYNSSVSRAYYATYQAALVALEVAGFRERNGRIQVFKPRLPMSLHVGENSTRLF